MCIKKSIFFYYHRKHCNEVHLYTNNSFLTQKNYLIRRCHDVNKIGTDLQHWLRYRTWILFCFTHYFSLSHHLFTVMHYFTIWLIYRMSNNGFFFKWQFYRNIIFIFYIFLSFRFLYAEFIDFFFVQFPFLIHEMCRESWFIHIALLISLFHCFYDKHQFMTSWVAFNTIPILFGVSVIVSTMNAKHHRILFVHSFDNNSSIFITVFFFSCDLLKFV